MTAPRDCEHGQLARACDRCADAREIAELHAECEALRADAERWRKWLPWIGGLNRKPFGLAMEIKQIDAARAAKEQSNG